jgi:hypothetical protein
LIEGGLRDGFWQEYPRHPFSSFLHSLILQFGKKFSEDYRKGAVMNFPATKISLLPGLLCLAMLWACGDDHPSQPELDDGIVGTVTDAAGDPVAGAAIGLIFDVQLPDRFAKPTTRIRFDLPLAGAVRVTVLDLRGDLLRVLVDGDLPQGAYSVTWDTRDESGQLVPNGLYEVVVESEGVELTRVSLLLSTQGLDTLFERANALSDDDGYFRIPRVLIPVGATIPAFFGEDFGEEVVDLVVSEDLTIEAAWNSEVGVTYTSVAVTLPINQDRLVVHIALP